MRPYFTDAQRIRELAIARAQRERDSLYCWWRDRYQPQVAQPWEDRTPGGLLEEYYYTLAVELERARADWRREPTPESRERVQELERVLAGQGEADTEDRRWLDDMMDRLEAGDDGEPGGDELEWSNPNG